MTRHTYFALCMRQPISWLNQCASNPSPGMTRSHVALVRLAIRKLSAAPRVPFVDVSHITEYGMTQKLSNAVRVF